MIHVWLQIFLSISIQYPILSTYLYMADINHTIFCQLHYCVAAILSAMAGAVCSHVTTKDDITRTMQKWVENLFPVVGPERQYGGLEKMLGMSVERGAADGLDTKCCQHSYQPWQKTHQKNRWQQKDEDCLREYLQPLAGLPTCEWRRSASSSV